MASTDRDALLVLYRSTSGAYWKKQTNWNTDVHLGLWHGVEVNAEGRVVKLELSRNGLRGKPRPFLRAPQTSLADSGGPLTQLQVLQ